MFEWNHLHYLRWLAGDQVITVYQVPPPCSTRKGASVASALGTRTAFNLPGVHKLISKPYCFYSNSGKKKAVLFVDEKLSSFFLNVGDKLHVDSNLFHQPWEWIEI